MQWTVNLNSIYAEFCKNDSLGLNKFNDKTPQLKPGFTTWPLSNERYPEYYKQDTLGLHISFKTEPHI